MYALSLKVDGTTMMPPEMGNWVTTVTPTGHKVKDTGTTRVGTNFTWNNNVQNLHMYSITSLISLKKLMSSKPYSVFKML